MSGLAKAQDAYVETVIEDETLVMRLDTGDFFSLTGTARQIWGMLDGTRDRAGLIADLAERYGAATAAVSADVDTFLAELTDAGLLQAG